MLLTHQCRSDYLKEKEKRSIEFKLKLLSPIHSLEEIQIYIYIYINLEIFREYGEIRKRDRERKRRKGDIKNEILKKNKLLR